MTLRLPPELHEAILRETGAMSMNAAIVRFLEYAIADYIEAGTREAMRDWDDTDFYIAKISQKEESKQIQKIWEEGFKEEVSQAVTERLEKVITETINKAMLTVTGKPKAE